MMEWKLQVAEKSFHHGLRKTTKANGGYLRVLGG